MSFNHRSLGVMWIMESLWYVQWLNPLICSLGCKSGPAFGCSIHRKPQQETNEVLQGLDNVAIWSSTARRTKWSLLDGAGGSMWSTCQAYPGAWSRGIYPWAVYLAWLGSGSQDSYSMLFLRTVAVHVCKPSLRCYLNFHGLSSHESVCSHICLFWGGEQHFSPCIYLASVVCSLLMFFLVSLGASLVNICMGNKNLTRSRTDFYSNTSSPRGRGWGGGLLLYVSRMLASVSSKMQPVDYRQWVR